MDSLILAHYPDQSDPGNAKAKNFDRSFKALLA
jgi:hypothetical protein